MQFSIVTPTRNALNQLKRCVGSVRQQESVSVQHLVQDACSSDGTAEWLSEQSDLLWRSERDAGMYDAINKGWARASGDVFSWLNSDEQYLPGTLAKVSDIFSRRQDVDWIFGNYIVVDQFGEAIAARREVDLQKSQLLYGILPTASCTMFFRRRLWDGGSLRLDSFYRYAADLKLVLNLVSNGHPGLHVPDYFSLFCFDGNNLSCSPEMIRETADIQRSFGARRGFVPKVLARGWRTISKLRAGGYRSTNLQYQYVLDEGGAVETKFARSIGGRYTTQ